MRQSSLMSNRSSVVNKLQVTVQLAELDVALTYAESIGDRLSMLRLIRKRLALRKLL